MSVPVGKVLDHLLESLLRSESEIRTLVLCESISKVAKVYPEEWCGSVCVLFSRLEPSSNQSEWTRLLGHIETIRPFPLMDPNLMGPIIEYGVTSLHSVDSDMRRESMRALRAIASVNPYPVLTKVSFCLKIYSLNDEIIELLNFFAKSTRETASLCKLLQLFQMLLSEDLKPEHIGGVASCVAAASNAVGSMEGSDLRNICMSLFDKLHPLCWKKNLMSSSALFGVYEAVVCIMCSCLANDIQPTDPKWTPIQSGVVRLLVSTRSLSDLVSVLNTVRVMAINECFLTTPESVSSAIPILIDVGISLGPLTLLNPDPPAPAAALLKLFGDMTDKGRDFLIDRVSMASKLSLLDKLVSIIFLHSALSKGHDHESFKSSAVQIDQLVSCIDALCVSSAEPFLNMAILMLLTRCALDMNNFLLTVPMIDFVISLAVMDPVSEAPSSLRAYWFSSAQQRSCSQKEANGGPSSSLVREYARKTLFDLSTLRNQDAKLVIKQRILDALTHRLNVCGLFELLTALSNVTNSISNHSKCIEILTFALVVLGPDSVGPFLSLFRPGLELRDVATFQSVVGSLEAGERQEIFELLLSKKIFSKCDILTCLHYASEIAGSLSVGAARAIVHCVQTCDQELMEIMSMKTHLVLSVFGDLITSLEFPEFQVVQSDLNQLVSKSKSRLIVLMGLKKNSTDLVFSIARTALGYAALKYPAEIISPVLQSQFLDPCVSTLNEALASGSGAAGSLPVIVTLESLAQILNSVSEYLIDNAFLNSLMSLILPLVVFHGDGTTVPLTALNALKASASVSGRKNFSISTKNFDHAIQFSVSVLVHGISTFSTIDTDIYKDRIDAVSNLLVSVLGHSFNKWLGLSRLGQLLSIAGSNSPLPILRAVTMRVFAEVSTQILASDDVKKNCMQWIECLVVVIPRTKDPVTICYAETLMNLFVGNPHTAISDILSDIQLVPNQYLFATFQLMLHASNDAHHESAVYILQLLNQVMGARAQALSAPETASLVSLMFVSAEKSLAALQNEILRCIHTLSSIHLASSLKEIITAVIDSDGNMTDSQQEAIRAIAKEKNLLLEFVNFVVDLINNSAPASDGCLAREPLIASKALQLALSVDDSLVPAMVSKFAPELVATALLLHANTNASDLIHQIFLNLNVLLPSCESPERIVSLFAETCQDEKQIETLVNFTIPFLKRNGVSCLSLRNQRNMAELILCCLTSQIEQLKNSDSVEAIRKAFGEVESIKGLSHILKYRRNSFRVKELEIVSKIAIANETQIDTVIEALQILITATEFAAKIDSDPAWKHTLLSGISIITEIIANKINSDVVSENVSLFKACLTLSLNLCEVLSFTHDVKAISDFKNTVSQKTLIEISIRRTYLSTLNQDSEHLFDKTLAKLETIAANRPFTYIDFEERLLPYLSPEFAMVSRSSASKSPLVVEGAAVLAVSIANSSSTREQARIVHALLHLLKSSQRRFLTDACKERVVGVLGDIILSF